ncbi:tetratricopeptide repeat protein [Ketobacter sp. MCCC 1A13808]|uniref:tetratricopeptide repeat protein n=1 Tax=Ketobacter sp. MCCC 1A13808 TaxID=2602738 RepID=UPI000F26D414|nr:tetratricopeptide repeat protein [Ketobacter sp. MCCC 1A13808]MVF11878.1 tetratricopeptide repeat protein [Ketobacter sp. MCCC 1A13808]RLP53060.1 MAG: hypothetical protein D6160_17595 [Ketobacter sp.]
MTKTSDEWMQQLRSLVEQKRWVAVNDQIAYQYALAGENPEATHYKIIAMVHIDEQRASRAFIDLVSARLEYVNNDASYLNMLADACMELEQFSDAIGYLNQLIHTYPENAYLHEKLVTVAEKAGDDALARVARTRFSFYAGKSLLAQREFERSAFYLDHTLHDPDHDVRAPLFIACCYRQLNQTDDALRTLKYYSADSDLYLDALETKLQIAIDEQDIELIRSLSAELAGMDENNISALRATAFVHEWIGETYQSLETYYRILQLYPYDVLATLKVTQLAQQFVNHATTGVVPVTTSQRIKVAKIMLNAGYEEAALQFVGSVASSDPQYLDCLFLQANHLIKQYEFKQALALLEAAFDNHTQNVELISLIAQCLRKLGHYERAIELALKGAELDPDHIMNQFWMAESLYDLLWYGHRELTENETQFTFRFYRFYATQQPRDGQPHQRLATLHYLQGSLREMRPYLDKAKDLGSYNYIVAFLYGFYELRHGSKEEALSYYSDSINLSADTPFFLAHLERAKLFIKEQAFEMAQQDIEVLQNGWPGNQRVRDLVFLLDERVAGESVD